MVTARGTMATSVDHRCIALRGAVGGDVTCRIYADRPKICRQVQAGDEMCRTARALFKLPGGAMTERALEDALDRIK